MEKIIGKQILSFWLFGAGLLVPILYLFYHIARHQLVKEYNYYLGFWESTYQWGLITTFLWISATVLSQNIWIRVFFGFMTILIGFFALFAGLIRARGLVGH